MKVTNQLDSGHVLLPPKVLLKVRSGCSEAVVGVHDDVDRRVHHGVEGTHSPG